MLTEMSKLVEHEEINLQHFKELKEEILSDGILKKPIAVEKNTNIILDGHHRFNILKSLNLTKIPIVLVDYNSSDVVVKAWRENEIITKDMVIDTVSRNIKFPPRTTKHFININGKLKHIEEIEKEINIPLQKLK